MRGPRLSLLQLRNLFPGGVRHRNQLRLRGASKPAGRTAGLLLTFALLCAGCFTHHHRQIGASLLDDKVTADRVQAALQTDGNPELHGVQVHSAGGVVTLSGVVQHPAAKERAAQIARSVHRVKKLQNDIQVQAR